MKKLSVVMVCFIFAMFSCKKTTTEKLFEPTDQSALMLKEKYKFNEFDKLVSFKEANLLISVMSKDIIKGRNLNLENVREFKSNEFNTAIYIFQDLNDKNQSIGIKGYFLNNN
jgi:hypothetical protein